MVDPASMLLKGNKDGLLHGLIRRALGLPGVFSGW